MTPINPQDRPKVIGLIVASMLMLGFVGKTAVSNFGPKKDVPPPTPAVAPATPPPAAGAPVPAAAPAPVAANDRTLELGGPEDPFRRVLPDPSRGNGAPPARFQAPRPRALSGSLGVAPLPVSGGPGASLPAADPAIRLDGIVSAQDHSAMLTIGDKTDLYRVGDQIAGTFRLIAVSDRDATFRGPSGVFTVNVGEERRPAAPQPRSMSQDAPSEVATRPILPEPMAMQHG